MLAFIAAVTGGVMLTVGSAFIAHRLTWKAGPLLAALIVIQALIAGNAESVPLLAVPVTVGGIGGYAFGKGKSFGFFLLASSLSLTVLIAGYLYYLIRVSGVDLFGMLKGQLAAYLTQAGAPEDVAGRLVEDFEASRVMLPFSIFFNSVILSGLGYLLVRPVCIHWMGAGPVRGLEYFRLNDYFVFVLIAGLAVLLLVDRKDYPVLNMAGLNLAMSAALLYFVQALGLLKFLLIRRGLPRFMLPMGVALIITLGPVGIFMAVILAGVGTLDIWADFRKLNEKNEG